MFVVAASILASVRVLWPKGLNSSFYLDVNNFARRTGWAHGFMHAYALWLGLALMVIVFLFAYAVAWSRRDVQAVCLLIVGGAGTLIALGLNQVVGHSAREERPYETYRHALVLVAKAHDYAFPSDHAVVAGALFASLLLVVRRAAPGGWRVDGALRAAAGGRPKVTGAMVGLVVAGAVVGLLLLFARVYVGAHYPGDVVAGALLGAAVVLVLSALRPLAYWLGDVVERTPLSVVLRRPSPGVGARSAGT